MRLTRALGLTLAATVVVALAACGSDEKNGTTAPKTIDKVNYATGFGMFGREAYIYTCLLYTSPSPRDRQKSRMPSSA